MLRHQSLGMLYEIGLALHDTTMIGGSLRGFFVLLATIVFIISILQCLFGYKLYRFWITLCGFLTFGIVGGVISGGIANSAEVGIFFGILFAIVGAFIVCKLYRVGIFILCSYMGFLLGNTIMHSIGVGLVIAIILGVLGILFTKPVIILSTSISGGIVAGSTLAFILRISETTGMNFLGVLFAAIGLFIQFYTQREPRLNDTDTKKTKKEGKNDLEEKLVNFIDNVKDTIIEQIKNTLLKIENKIEKLNQVECNEYKTVTINEVRQDLMSILCKHKVFKYIMPFVEYVLYALGALEIILFFIRLGTPRALTINFTIFLIFVTLNFIKEKYQPIVVTSFIMALSKVMLFSLRIKLTRFIDLVIMITILASAIKEFMDTTENKMIE